MRDLKKLTPYLPWLVAIFTVYRGYVRLEFKVEALEKARVYYHGDLPEDAKLKGAQ
jgi:hypothetical protein